MSQAPTVGRVVLYCLPDDRHLGEERPADVVRVWTDGLVNLLVKLDGENDTGDRHALPLRWATSVEPSASGEPEPGRWRWPPRAPA